MRLALLTLKASGEVRSRTVQRFGQNSRFLELAYFRGTQVKTAYFVNSVLRLNYKDLRLGNSRNSVIDTQEASGQVLEVERSSGLVRTAVSWNMLIFHFVFCKILELAY